MVKAVGAHSTKPHRVGPRPSRPREFIGVGRWGLERGYGFITRHRAPRLYFASGETLTQSIFKDLAVQGTTI